MWVLTDSRQKSQPLPSQLWGLWVHSAGVEGPRKPSPSRQTR